MLAVSITSGLDYVNFQDSSLIYNLEPGTLVSEGMDVLRTHVGAGTNDSFRLLSSTVDQLGITHDKYQQVFAGIDVAGGVYTIHSAGGQINTLSGEFFDVDPGTPIFAGLGNELAAERALEYMSQREVHGHGTGDNVHLDEPKQFVWEDPVLAELVGLDGPLTGELTYVTNSENQIELVYQFELYVIEPVVERTLVYVNADTGQITGDLDMIHAADTEVFGTSLYDGNIDFIRGDVQTPIINFRLRSAGDIPLPNNPIPSGIGVETYDLNGSTNYGAAVDYDDMDGTFSDPDQHNGIQGHWGTLNTVEYFQQVHGRNSFDDAGTTLRSYLSYNVNYVNAFWNGSFMTYGDGNGTTWGPLTSLDVVGHEIAHGVTEYSAGLIYSYESGALNESFSDIFGESVERWARGSNDWAIGGDFDLVDGDGFRSMSNPNAKGDPDTYMGDLWWTSAGDNGGVHVNSGVQNKWFYILSVGEAGTNDHGFVYNVTPISQDDAEAIAYRNLTTYLTPGSTFQDARDGAVQAAIDLFGYGSQQHISTGEAWEAVGVYAISSDVEFTQLNPEGSLIYESLASGEISATNPSDRYTIELDPGQQLTIIVEGADAGLLPDVTWYDTFALPVTYGPTVGNTTVVQTLDATLPGVYEVEITGNSGSVGTYDLRFLLNSDIEMETFGVGDNGTLLTADSLEPGSLDLGNPLTTTADRMATVGFLTAGTDPGILEDFESGPSIVDYPDWEVYSSHPGGVVEVTDAYGASTGSFALVMEQAAFGTFNLNEAIYTVDLDGIPSPYLNFDHVSFGDENDRLPAAGFTGHYPGDGVSISEDGISWYPVMTDVTPPQGLWESVSIDLQAAADFFGITLGTETKIKFQQYDNFDVSFADGRGFDNISVGLADSVEDWYSFDLTAGERATIAGTNLNDTLDTFVELFDATETSLVAGTPGANVTSWISQFSAPVDGTYYVRVTGDGDYSLVVTRDAEFDLEEGIRDITNVSGALGHVQAVDTAYAEPDDFNDGDFLDAAFPGVILSNGVVGSVYAAQAEFTPPTGELVFAHTPGADEGWRESDGNVLRASFLAEQSYVSIDVGSDDNSDVAFLRAYDFTGTLLQQVTSGGVPNGGSETIFIQRAANEIAYVEASGVGGDITPLDRLVFKQIAVDQDIYTIDLALSDTLDVTGYLPGGGIGQFTNLLGEGASNELRLELVDPSLVSVASGVDTLQHVATAAGTYQLIVSANNESGEYYVTHEIDPLIDFRFDINRYASPTEAGFIGVNRFSNYNAVDGYGWTLFGEGGTFVQSSGTDLERDGVYTKLSEFAVDVPAGDYEVELFFGNQQAALPQQSVFTLEGSAFSISPPANSSFSRFITVTDGQFNLILDGNGGLPPHAELSGFRISEITSYEWNFDINRYNSPTAAGFTGVNRFSTYNTTDRYGWTFFGEGGTFVQASGSDLEIDGVYTKLAEFAADVPNGDYEIELYFGNQQAALPQQSVFILEGNSFSLSPPANSSFIQVVTVSDGQFNLTLDGDGGRPPHAELSGFRVSPVVAPPITGFFAGGLVDSSGRDSGKGDTADAESGQSVIVQPDFGTAELVRNQSVTVTGNEWKCDNPGGHLPTKTKPGSPDLAGMVTTTTFDAATPIKPIKPSAELTTVKSLAVSRLDQVFAKALDDVFGI